MLNILLTHSAIVAGFSVSFEGDLPRSLRCMDSANSGPTSPPITIAPARNKDSVFRSPSTYNFITDYLRLNPRKKEKRSSPS